MEWEEVTTGLDAIAAPRKVLPFPQPRLSAQTIANVLIALDGCANHFTGEIREFARETLKQVRQELSRG